MKLIATAFAFLAALAIAAAPQASAAEVRTGSAKRSEAVTWTVSRDVRSIAEWAVATGDHQRRPFMIVDKRSGFVAAYDAAGRLLRTAPILIGMGVGDVFPPGVIDLDMYQTKPWQRVTPAGRFVSEVGRNLDGQHVLWVDYDGGIAIHKIPSKFTKQRRHERIRSANPADKRITYGCINVPPSFYDRIVRPHFTRKGGVVYVLPDTLPLEAVFKSYRTYKAAAPAQRQARAQTQRF